MGQAIPASAQTVKLNPSFVILGADPNLPVGPVTVTSTITGVKATSLDVPAGGITGTISGDQATITVDPKKAHEGANNMYLLLANGQKQVVKFFVFGHTAGSVAEMTANFAVDRINAATASLNAKWRTELSKMEGKVVKEATEKATNAARAEVPGIVRQEAPAIVSAEVAKQFAAQLGEGGELRKFVTETVADSEARSAQRVQDAISQLGCEVNADIAKLAATRVQKDTSWLKRFVGADKVGQLSPELARRQPCPPATK